MSRMSSLSLTIPPEMVVAAEAETMETINELNYNVIKSIFKRD